MKISRLIALFLMLFSSRFRGYFGNKLFKIMEDDSGNIDGGEFCWL